MMNRFTFWLERRKYPLVIVLGLMLSASLVGAIGHSDAAVQDVVIVGDIDTAQLKAVRGVLGAQELELRDLDDIRARMLQMSWVNHAGVAYQWPDRLIVTIVPEQPIAYWNEQDFINADGRVFRTTLLSPGNLPLLYGPSGQEGDVMAHYQALSRMLLPAGQLVEQLRMNERGGVSFRNQYGTWVRLGNVDLNQRVARFLRVLRELDEVNDVVEVDARYASGVAVRNRSTEVDDASSALVVTSKNNTGTKEERNSYVQHDG